MGVAFCFCFILDLDFDIFELFYMFTCHFQSYRNDLREVTLKILSSKRNWNKIQQNISSYSTISTTKRTDEEKG